MKHSLFVLACLVSSIVYAQSTFPVNGPQDLKAPLYALENATVFIDYQTRIDEGLILVQKDKILYIGKASAIPKEAIRINCKGKYIYPGFIDLYSAYGINPPADNRKGEGETHGFVSAKKGAYNWNEAIRAEQQSVQYFVVDEKKADFYRSVGFGAVLAGSQDGICRGSATFVYTGNAPEREMIIKPQAAALFSFSKGTSRQHYPSSLMGSIALLRQTYLDADWYTQQSVESNLTLSAFNQLKQLPAIFVAGSKHNITRADKVGDEFGKQYIIKGTGEEYQRLDEIKQTNAPLIVPVNFPKPYEVDQFFATEYISTADLKHWELAPYNLRYLYEKQIPFAITADECQDAKTFWSNLRKAVKCGLPEKEALKALTHTPASILGVKAGELHAGGSATLVISSGNLFTNESDVQETWVNGERYIVTQEPDMRFKGVYSMQLSQSITLTVTATQQKSETQFRCTGWSKDTIPFQATFQKGMFQAHIPIGKGKDSVYRLVGWVVAIDSTTTPYLVQSINGKMIAPNGVEQAVKLVYSGSGSPAPIGADSTLPTPILPVIPYPFTDYAPEKQPQQLSVVFRNATVWTNEKQGTVTEADVWVKDGKIKAIGKKLSAPGALEIDATGKHLTSGIIDEHSHIAISNGVNEGTQSSSAEVRIGDVINHEDINIYRQLSGGVVAAQLLHGSANPIGGQSALVKLRWGFSPDQLKIEGADGFIKFALGENVKQSNWGERNTFRYPQTRMGVEQVFLDAFQRAKAYEQIQKENPKTRKDLELEATLEILRGKRFITCHSYVQSEINMLMHVADSMGFRVNTFTHILEGYKVADKMKKHGVHASTFADWWAYKYEVMEAIPYNAALLHQVGVVTAINSDDAEMGRRLNQEAAKVVKYGGVSEEEAWKMVTLNPAKILHIDHRTGSIREGKDADLVLWSAHPLSVYAKAEYTLVDGRIEYSLQQDEKMRQGIRAERERIIQLMVKAKQKGEKAEKKMSKPQDEYHCDDEN